MKLFKIYLIAIAVFATISATAAEKNETDNQIDIFKKWETINRKISEKLEPTLVAVPKVGDFTKDDFSNWKTACGLVIDNYNKMGNYNGTTEPKFDLPNDWKLNSKLYKAIKDGKSVNGIDETLASEWETAYKAFEDKYKQVKKSCEEMYSEKQKDTKATSPTATKIDTLFVYKSTYDSPDSIDKMNNLIKENYRLTEQNKLLQQKALNLDSQSKSYEDAFYVCVKFPLNVKYHVAAKSAYNAAKGLYESGVVTDSAYIIGWKEYAPLLENYEKYNNELIVYLEKQKRRYAARNWKISRDDINTMKKDISFDLPGYGIYYGKEINIRYLDYVINKFFSILEATASGNFDGFSEEWFDHFIKTELKPTEFN